MPLRIACSIFNRYRMSSLSFCLRALCSYSHVNRLVRDLDPVDLNSAGKARSWPEMGLRKKSTLKPSEKLGRYAAWSPHAQDLISKRLFTQEKVSIPQWIHAITSRVTNNYFEGRKVIRKKYFSLLHGKYFFPTTAALHNSISGQGSLAGCIVLPLANHPQEIIAIDLPKITRLLMQGIGVGLNVSHLPPKTHPDAKTARCHSGPVETLKALAAATEALVNHGGVKRPAYMGTLSATHPDIGEFIALKSHHAIPSMNVSVCVDEMFKIALATGELIPFSYSIEGDKNFLSTTMLALMEKEADKRGLPGPDLSITLQGHVVSRALGQAIGVVKENVLYLSPQCLLRELARLAHACGDPGLIDLEAINRGNPTHPRFLSQRTRTMSPLLGVGEIMSTTPCGEQPLLPYEVCHLGSFNLAAFTSDQGFDFTSFRQAIPIAVQLMDDLIDLSDTQLHEANEIARANRKIGLGVMGLADTFAKLNIPYASVEGLELAEKIVKTLQHTSRKASENLAVMRGAFKTFAHSRFAFHGMKPRRHATLTTIAPTGHISTLADCSPSIEPYYLLSYTRQAAGRRVHDNQILADKLAQLDWSLEKWIAHTKQLNSLYEFDGTLVGLSPSPFEEPQKNDALAKLKQTFLTAGLISPEDHLKMVAIFQKYVDNGVSKTINLPTTATVEDVYHILIQAMALGLKGITVYRNRCQELQALSPPGECSTCDIYPHNLKKVVQYPHILQCLDTTGSIKYQLPAMRIGENQNYWIYSRPHPVVDHQKKNQRILLPYPELVFVAKEECHCISVGFDQGKAVNMYININLPPKELVNGHAWYDLELDIRMTKESDGSWTSTLVDEEEFEAASLTESERLIAGREVEVMFEKIAQKAFPFNESFGELEKLLSISYL